MTTAPILPAAPPGRADLAALGPGLGVVLGPQAGETLRALVMARLEDGLIRLVVPGNPPVNVRASSDIQPGMTVEIAAEADPDDPGKPAQLVVRGQAAAVAETAEPSPSLPATPEAARAQVVAATSQAAAQRQSGLGPLMADLAQAASAADTPPAVKAAAAQVLAARQPTDRPPTSDDIRQAVSRSGLFLESRLATQTPLVASPAAGDMKAALLAVRQVLKAWQAAAVAPPPEETATSQPASARAAPEPNPSTQTPTTPTTAPRPQSTPAQPAPPQSAQPQATSPQPAGQQAAPSRPALPATAEAPEEAPLTAQQAVLPQAAPMPTPQAAASTRGTALALTALEILSAAAQDAAPAPAADPHSVPAPVPPPPYRGGPITAQPQAAATLPPTAEPAVLAQRLLQEAGGALARQELLQLASLPDTVTDSRAAQAPRAEQAQRWMFEIPFAAPQGAAVAQFEISRDGRRKGQDDGKSSDPAEPVWRTRFSIDIEPMGPVHAQLALSGERVQVSLWAERETGLARLRDQAPLLTQALNRAVAGPDGSAEVAVHPGAPHRPMAAAGRFVDVAS